MRECRIGRGHPLRHPSLNCLGLRLSLQTQRGNRTVLERWGRTRTDELVAAVHADGWSTGDGQCGLGERGSVRHSPRTILHAAGAAVSLLGASADGDVVLV